MLLNLMCPFGEVWDLYKLIGKLTKSQIKGKSLEVEAVDGKRNKKISQIITQAYDPSQRRVQFA